MLAHWGGAGSSLQRTSSWCMGVACDIEAGPPDRRREFGDTSALAGWDAGAAGLRNHGQERRALCICQ